MGPRFFSIAFHTLCTLVLATLLTSCKAKKTVLEGGADASLTTRRIIQNHYENAMDFKTMSGKVRIDYQEGDTNQGFTVSFRMKKDGAIWASAPLGIFKAYITPERVSFYNKLERNYFDGDFTHLSKVLGYEMDFGKVQNLLLGNTVLDLRDEKYVSTIEGGGYFLRPKQQKELFKILFSLEPKNFRATSQQISQPGKNRFLKLEHGYQNIASKIAPSEMNIEAVNEEGSRMIRLDFRNIEFDRKLNFPYKIPKGFKVLVSK